VTATYVASGIEGQHMWCGRAMIGMRRCLQCLECGCKVWYVQMSPDVVLECQECGLELSLFTYWRLLEHWPQNPGVY